MAFAKPELSNAERGYHERMADTIYSRGDPLRSPVSLQSPVSGVRSPVPLLTSSWDSPTDLQSSLDPQPLAELTHRVQGKLRLNFGYDRARAQTVLHVREQQQPLKVIRAFPLAHGGALVHVHNLSGGVLGGDHLQLTVEVEPEAYAQLTSTSATRLYRSRPSAPCAIQTSEVRVAQGALLEYLPDPIIPFAGSRYLQQTRIVLADGAGLFWWETIAPGRTACGELFAYDLLQTDFTITALNRPVAIERYKLVPSTNEIASPARLGVYRYYSSFYILKVGVEAAEWARLEGQLNMLARELSVPGEESWGVSLLVAHGLAVRGISRQGKDIAAGLYAFWRAAKQALYGREAVLPRKIY